MDSIYDIARSLNELYNKQYELLKPGVIGIIRDKSKDVKLIEKYLELLLNIPSDECENLFNILCDYLKNIDSNMAEEYAKFYKELWSDEYEKERH